MLEFPSLLLLHPSQTQCVGLPMRNGQDETPLNAMWEKGKGTGAELCQLLKET